MSRSTEEWIGKTDNEKIPPRVRLRVFKRHDGICHISGRPIRAGEPWDCDHIVALVNGGEHRETNLAPALRDKHREKTKDDVAEKSRVYHKAAKNIGVDMKPSRHRIQSRRFAKAPPQRSASRAVERKHPEAV